MIASAGGRGIGYEICLQTFSILGFQGDCRFRTMMLFGCLELDIGKADSEMP
jgi:hypothetical protein